LLLDDLGAKRTRIGERHDLIVVAVNDEVGTSNFFRSYVRSVAENVLTPRPLVPAQVLLTRINDHEMRVSPELDLQSLRLAS